MPDRQGTGCYRAPVSGALARWKRSAEVQSIILDLCMQEKCAAPNSVQGPLLGVSSVAGFSGWLLTSPFVSISGDGNSSGGEAYLNHSSGCEHLVKCAFQAIECKGLLIFLPFNYAGLDCGAFIVWIWDIRDFRFIFKCIFLQIHFYCATQTVPKEDCALWFLRTNKRTYLFETNLKGWVPVGKSKLEKTVLIKQNHHLMSTKLHRNVRVGTSIWLNHSRRCEICYVEVWLHEQWNILKLNCLCSVSNQTQCLLFSFFV